MFSRDRAGDEDAVGMSRRGDELDAEPAGIEDDIAERVGLDLAAVAAAGADLAQAQRAAEQAAAARGSSASTCGMLVAGSDQARRAAWRPAANRA